MSGDIEDDDISDREWDLGDTPRELSPRIGRQDGKQEEESLTLLFAELDPKGEGSVGKQRFLAAVQTARVHKIVKASNDARLLDLVRPGRWKGLWRNLDADGNGSVELEDFERVYGTRIEMVHEGKQGYGEVDEEEEPTLTFLLRSIFRKIDASGDGVASKLEVLRFVQRDFEQIRAVVETTGNKEFEQLLKPQRWRQAFAKMDVDGDGKITEDEFALFCETFFSSAAAGDIFQKSKEQPSLAIPELKFDTRTKDEKLKKEHERRKEEFKKLFDLLVEQNGGGVTYSILLRALQTDDRLISLLDSCGIWTEEARKTCFLRVFKSMDVAFQKKMGAVRGADDEDEDEVEKKEEEATSKDLEHISFSDMLSVLPPLKPDRSSVPDDRSRIGEDTGDGSKFVSALEDLDFDYEEKRGETGWARTSPRAMNQNKKLTGSVLGDRLRQARLSRVLVIDRMHLTSLPLKVCSLRTLRDLSMDGNGISVLPAEILHLESLTRLSCAHNSLQALPDTIGMLQNLLTLDVGSNILEALPESIGRLHQLKHLDVSENELTTFPLTMGSCAALEHIVAYGNPFEASMMEKFQEGIPMLLTFLRACKSVSEEKAQEIREEVVLQRRGDFNVDTELLTEDMPRTNLDLDSYALAEFRMIEYYAETRKSVLINRLEGKVGTGTIIMDNMGLDTVPPNVFAKPDETTKVMMAGNQISMLPDAIGKLVNLTLLDLEKCRLRELPSKAIPALRKLEILNVSHNELVTLPESVGELENLRVLDVSHNHLQEIPYSVSQLGVLQRFACHSNPLTDNTLTHILQSDGIVAFQTYLLMSNEDKMKKEDIYRLLHELQQCTKRVALAEKTHSLNLRDCSLTEVPEEATSLGGITDIDLSHNKLKMVPPALTRMLRVTRFSASHNLLRIEGVPSNLNRMFNITVLDLSANKLDAFPFAICKLKKLRVLDISRNLIPNLPPQFAGLDKLERVNIDDNPTMEDGIVQANARGVVFLLNYLKNRKAAKKKAPILMQQKKWLKKKFPSMAANGASSLVRQSPRDMA